MDIYKVEIRDFRWVKLSTFVCKNSQEAINLWLYFKQTLETDQVFLLKNKEVIG